MRWKIDTVFRAPSGAPLRVKPVSFPVSLHSALIPPATLSLLVPVALPFPGFPRCLQVLMFHWIPPSVHLTPGLTYRLKNHLNAKDSKSSPITSPEHQIPVASCLLRIAPGSQSSSSARLFLLLCSQPQLPNQKTESHTQHCPPESHPPFNYHCLPRKQKFDEQPKIQICLFPNFLVASPISCWSWQTSGYTIPCLASYAPTPLFPMLGSAAWLIQTCLSNSIYPLTFN